MPADPPKSLRCVTLLLRNQGPSGQETGNILITPGNKRCASKVDGVDLIPTKLSLSGLVDWDFVLDDYLGKTTVPGRLFTVQSFNLNIFLWRLSVYRAIPFQLPFLPPFFCFGGLCRLRVPWPKGKEAATGKDWVSVINFWFHIANLTRWWLQNLHLYLLQDEQTSLRITLFFPGFWKKQNKHRMSRVKKISKAALICRC